MYVLVCLFLEPISRSKDPVNIKIGSVLCLRTPVPETEDIYIYHCGAPFLRMYLRWSLCTLYLLACQVRVTVGAQVFVVFMCDVFRVLTNSLC